MGVFAVRRNTYEQQETISGPAEAIVEAMQITSGANLESLRGSMWPA